jgi:predicted phosphoribosyltransferase
MAFAAFADRFEAGQALAKKLVAYARRPGVVVLGVPRGGVPVAEQVARALGIPLDVFVVRKLGVPGHEELAMGALASGGVGVINDEVVSELGITEDVINRVTLREARELARRERVYRGERPAAEVAGKTVILVDDGLATGASMLAAIAALRRRGPAAIVVGVPVAPSETCRLLGREVDDLVCAATPEPFGGVGRWYDNFAQTSDAEVRAALDRAATRPTAPQPAPTLH